MNLTAVRPDLRVRTMSSRTSALPLPVCRSSCAFEVCISLFAYSNSHFKVENVLNPLHLLWSKCSNSLTSKYGNAVIVLSLLFPDAISHTRALFTCRCDNGECVPSHYVCDLWDDCGDNSDEEQNCKL